LRASYVKRAADGCDALPYPLSANAQLGDERSIPLDVVAPEVVEHPTPPTDEHQQTSLTVKVLLVDLHVFGQMADTLRQQRNLHFGRACVGVVQLVVADRGRFVGHARV
jgi:hypothetical protein